MTKVPAKYTEVISDKILTIRGQKVILDSDLAELYGAETKRLNEQVKRNSTRFPEDFAFQLTKEEVELNWSQIATSSGKNRGKSYRPYAFTEHGAIMAANVLRSAKAVEMSVFVVRAFIQMRHMLVSVKDLSRKIDAMEQQYDEQFKVAFEAIKQLMDPPAPDNKKIGYHVKEKRSSLL